MTNPIAKLKILFGSVNCKGFYNFELLYFPLRRDFLQDRQRFG